MMTPGEFEAFVRDAIVRARHVGGDVHVFVIVAPRGPDARTQAPLSAGTLDAEGQVAVLRAIAASLEKESMRPIFSKPLDEQKP